MGKINKRCRKNELFRQREKRNTHTKKYYKEDGENQKRGRGPTLRVRRKADHKKGIPNKEDHLMKCEGTELDYQKEQRTKKTIKTYFKFEACSKFLNAEMHLHHAKREKGP